MAWGGGGWGEIVWRERRRRPTIRGRRVLVLDCGGGGGGGAPATGGVGAGLGVGKGGSAGYSRNRECTVEAGVGHPRNRHALADHKTVSRGGGNRYRVRRSNRAGGCGCDGGWSHVRRGCGRGVQPVRADGAERRVPALDFIHEPLYGGG